MHAEQIAAGQDASTAIEQLIIKVEGGDLSALLPRDFADLCGNAVDKDRTRRRPCSRRQRMPRSREPGAAGHGYQSLATPEGSEDRAGGFQRAVDAGEPKGLIARGFAYQAGKGMRKKRNDAIDLFSKAALAGQSGAGTVLRLSDANAYIRLVQQQSQIRGLLQGPANSLADAMTIGALVKLCQSADIPNACRQEPLAPTAAEAIVESLEPIANHNDRMQAVARNAFAPGSACEANPALCPTIRCGLRCGID